MSSTVKSVAVVTIAILIGLLAYLFGWDVAKWSNAAVAAFTVVLAIVAIQQAAISARQVETQRVVERAYVFVTAVSEFSGFVAGVHPTMTVIVSNAGNTPAVITGIQGSYRMKNREVAQATSAAAPMAVDFVVPGNQQADWGIEFEQTCDPHDWRVLAEENDRAVFTGRVKYRDAFGTERSTDFGFVFKAAIGLEVYQQLRGRADNIPVTGEWTIAPGFNRME